MRDADRRGQVENNKGALRVEQENHRITVLRTWNAVRMKVHESMRRTRKTKGVIDNPILMRVSRRGRCPPADLLVDDFTSRHFATTAAAADGDLALHLL